MDLWQLSNMKVILTLWTLNYADCLSFSCIDSFHITHNRANLFFKKIFSYFEQNQAAINLIKVFDFMG